MPVYIIKSTQREEPHCYFVAIHSYTPHFGKWENAKVFTSEQAAESFALDELFTTRDAFEIVTLSTSRKAVAS